MFKQCKKCLHDNNNLLWTQLDEDICPECKIHNEKYITHWDSKKKELACIIYETKKQSKTYDCIVPVTGDAEDYYVLKTVIELELNPLVISVNDYFKNDLGWHNFHNLITYFDVDSMVFNPDIRVYKDLIRTSLRKFDDILLPFLFLHTSFPTHIAMQRKIPLIIWGREHELLGNNIDKLIGNGAQVNEKDLNYYKCSNSTYLDEVEIKTIYLNNYMEWDSLKQNHSILNCGFVPEYNYSSFDIYEKAGSSIYYDFHDLLKYKRMGYRNIRDHLAREIRHGRVTKEKAIEIESYYNNSKVDVHKFFNWLGMSKSGQDWFIMHQLKGLEHLIGDKYELDIKLPMEIDNLIVKSSKSEKDFILFDKGI